jgi:hypothetical protein
VRLTVRPRHAEKARQDVDQSDAARDDGMAGLVPGEFGCGRLGCLVGVVGGELGHELVEAVAHVARPYPDAPRLDIRSQQR